MDTRGVGFVFPDPQGLWWKDCAAQREGGRGGGGKGKYLFLRRKVWALCGHPGCWRSLSLQSFQILVKKALRGWRGCKRPLLVEMWYYRIVVLTRNYAFINCRQQKMFLNTNCIFMYFWNVWKLNIFKLLDKHAKYQRAHPRGAFVAPPEGNNKTVTLLTAFRFLLGFHHPALLAQVAFYGREDVWKIKVA